MKTILLIDGKNTAYRALFATMRSGEVHPFVVWMRFLHVWFDKFNPSEVHVFWDCPKDEVWRKSVLPEYKDQRETMKHYADDVKLKISNLVKVAKALLPHMNIRQYYKKTQECDDLIYSACRILTPDKSDSLRVIVVSSDSDFVQLQWSMEHVKCLEPKSCKFFDTPTINPIYQKSLIGDKSDNIDGYNGIGKVKSAKLINSPNNLIEFLDKNGSKLFLRNISLIDLSKNPYALKNELYLIKNMSLPINYDESEIKRLIYENKINGLIHELTRIVLPFSKLK